ncbi:Rhomboid-like protein 19 [Erysiphe necator]|uniref:Putative eukaryotic integral membrane protein n=1 Tax=Uncinula necator TaxID=52586 RepID=A0A0B1P2J7_UNCNE|nr:Rhomboid-like protein 19 [Erysiphe necator]KHJ30864.1 putative eukaryotic integral membrane protein [Erysiphe necator]
MSPRVNLPPVTRILLPALIFQSILGMAIRFRHATESSEVIIAWLVFLPTHSLYYPWTLFTATLVENDLIALTVAALTIFYGGRYLERAWTSAEFLKFLLVASFIPNIICYGVLFFLFKLSGNSDWTNTIIQGTLPLQISFLVAFSQLIPAHTVTIFKGLISIRITRLSIIHILGVSLLALTPILSAASFFLDVAGFFASWIYLRFFKRAFPDLQISQSSLRGDNSETFAFAEFFPTFAKPAVSILSNKIYDILVTLRICAPISTTDVSTARGELFTQRGVSGSARAEAERQRNLALKILDQRLNAATAKNNKNLHVHSPTLAGPSINTQSQPVGLEQEKLRGDNSHNSENGIEQEKITN